MKELTYYEFMIFVNEIKVNYNDLHLMENIIALFSIKNKNDLIRIRNSEYQSKLSQTPSLLLQETGE